LLEQIRRHHDPPQQAIVAAPSNSIADKPPPRADDGRPDRLIGQTFRAAAPLHAQARESHADLTFTTGRLHAFATLTSVTKQRAKVDGCMLSRSLWLSGKATTGYRRGGANGVVAVIDDRAFRDARSRANHVLPWPKCRFAMSES
jgi:hypothetical protein